MHDRIANDRVERHEAETRREQEKRANWPNSCAFLRLVRENSLLFLNANDIFPIRFAYIAHWSPVTGQHQFGQAAKKLCANEEAKATN